MNAQQLKNAILQEAIEGRLVPQDPNDEPASVLLARIRKEKERLVKEGKLKKKDLKVKPISEDEIPFEIPESWEWVRMSSLIQLLSGQDFPPEKYNSNNKGVPYITGASNIENGKLVINRWTEFPSVIGRVGDLLIVCKGSGVGKMCISDIPIYHIARQIQIIRCFSSLVLLDYLKVNIDANLSNIVANAQGVIPGISRDHILDLLLPIPPLAEQHRIVAKIEELLPKVEEYGKAKDALNKLNAELPERLKKSILQEAIEGRLVPQDPNDEPASVLLDKIRKEKELLIRDRKLILGKPEKKVHQNEEEDIDIPQNWTWCQINDICRTFGRIGFRGYTKEDLRDSPKDGAITLSPSNIINGKLDITSCTYLSWEKYEESPEIQVKEGDIILVKTASIGKCALVNEVKHKMTVNPQFVVLKDIKICNVYLYYLLLSPYVQDKIQSYAIGTSIPTYSQVSLISMKIPLPPLAEQHRIVEKLEQLLGKIDNLKL